MYPAGMTIPAMLERLAALPRPRAIERRDDEPLPERTGL
jgi:antitoxin VapB